MYPEDPALTHTFTPQALEGNYLLINRLTFFWIDCCMEGFFPGLILKSVGGFFGVEVGEKAGQGSDEERKQPHVRN